MSDMALYRKIRVDRNKDCRCGFLPIHLGFCWKLERIDEPLHIRCPSGCDLGERDDGNRRWDCDTCGGMGFVPVRAKGANDE